MDQHRYEDRQAEELRKIRQEMGGIRSDLKTVADRLLIVFAIGGLLVFVIPIIAPFVRSALGF